MDAFNIWWVWLVLGLTAPLAAWTSLSVPQLAVAFAVLSLISWFVMRRIFGFRGAKAKVFDHDIND